MLPTIIGWLAQPASHGDLVLFILLDFALAALLSSLRRPR